MKLAALLVVVFLSAVPAGSGLASTVTLTPSGGGVFVMEGQAFQDVSGLDIVLSYDPAVLRSPRIDQGSLISGALMMSNTANPGIIRIASVSQGPVQGSGTIARITFAAAAGQGGGAISGLNVSAISSAGNKSQLPTFIGALSQDQGPSSQTVTSAAEVAPPTTSAAAPPMTIAFVPAVPMVSLPLQKDKEERTNVPSKNAADTAGQVPGAGEEPAALEGGREGHQQFAGSTARELQRTMLTRKSVLDLFRDFPGPWNVQTTIKLFQQDETLGYRQSPQVAFSDGATSATLTIIVAAGVKDRPELTMENGTVLSVIRDRESTNAWIVKVRPEKDAVEASLRVDDGVTVRSIPLTVSPRINVDVDKSGTVTEKDFLLYFQSREPAGGSAGVRNYRVDYIFAANYLVAAGQAKVHQKMTAR